MTGEPKSVLALLIVLPLCAAVSAYLSVLMFIEAVRPVPSIGQTLFWILLGLWAAGLLALIVRPVNVAAMKLLGARTPTPEERRILNRTWRDVLDQVDMSSSRFTLLVADSGRSNAWLHCDLGRYVVAIDEEVIGHLDYPETAAMLLQRLARQRSNLALLVGICLWAAAPLVVILALVVAAFRAVRRIGRVFSSAGDRTNSQTVIGLIFYAIVLACFVGLLVIGASFAIVVLFALLVALLTAWLARRAELTADLVTAHWGRGRSLRRGLARLHELRGSPGARSLRIRIADQFSTYAPTPKRLAHLGKVDLGYSQLENPNW